MQNITADTALLDLMHMENPEMIAAYLLEDEAGVAVVDPGPTSTIGTLRAKLEQRGVSIKDIHTILLTHIHIDHAGGTGVLVRENPSIRVFVHERGAPHLIDPSRLVQSARRLYGSEMDHMWGEILAAPAGNVHPLRGGEELTIGNRRLEVVYTPGHASHHVSYFDLSNGMAFVGDTGGIRLSQHGYVLPPTPPPDIDLVCWRNSLKTISQRKPERILLTHFGPVKDADEHLLQLQQRLEEWSQLARSSLKSDDDDSERASSFVKHVATELRQLLPEKEAIRYEKNTGLRHFWYGLARYWRQRGGI